MNSTKYVQISKNGNLKLSNVHLVDVVNGIINRDVIINVSNGLISKIHKAVKKTSSIGNIEKNMVELWAIPGLIDSHVHLFGIHQEAQGREFDKNFETAKILALANINEALKVGVTCVRDTGAYSAYNNQFRDIVEAKIHKFKFRIVSCGRHITKRNGHWDDRGVVWDPSTRSLERIVSNELKIGADFIKVMNDNPIFNLSELKKIASVCKRMGQKFSCHAFRKETIDLAFAAGADTIEHAACYSEEFCEKVIQKGIAVCPTVIAAIDSIENIDDVSSITKDCSKQEFEEWASFLHQHVPSTFKAGVKVIAGTDAGTFPTDFQSLPREIIHFSKLGATNLQALQSATINAAEALGIADITGSLEPKKSADIVLLGKNPLYNIEEAIRDVKIVISRGHIVINNLEG